MLLQYSKENWLVNPNVINPKRYFYHCQETPPSWLEVLLTLHVYRGVTLFHSGCRSTKETPTWPGDYHKSLQNQHSEKYKFEKLIDLSCVSGFLQHLIFIKDQECWLTHGAIFPFVPFFYWPLTGSSRMNEGLSVPASAIQARGVLPYTSHIGMCHPKG